MTKKPTGGSAHPTIEANGVNFGEPGTTIRDEFAKEAMGAVIIATWGKVEPAASTFEERARYSYAMADAMILEREK